MTTNINQLWLVSCVLLCGTEAAPVLPPADLPTGFLPEEDWRAGAVVKPSFKTDVQSILKRVMPPGSASKTSNVQLLVSDRNRVVPSLQRGGLAQLIDGETQPTTAAKTAATTAATTGKTSHGTATPTKAKKITSKEVSAKSSSSTKAIKVTTKTTNTPLIKKEKTTFIDFSDKEYHNEDNTYEGNSDGDSYSEGEEPDEVDHGADCDVDGDSSEIGEDAVTDEEDDDECNRDENDDNVGDNNGVMSGDGKLKEEDDDDDDDDDDANEKQYGDDDNVDDRSEAIDLYETTEGPLSPDYGLDTTTESPLSLDNVSDDEDNADYDGGDEMLLDGVMVLAMSRARSDILSQPSDHDLNNHGPDQSSSADNGTADSYGEGDNIHSGEDRQVNNGDQSDYDSSYNESE